MRYLIVKVFWLMQELLQGPTALLLFERNVKAARNINLKCGLVKGHIWVSSHFYPPHAFDGSVKWDFQPNQLNSVRSIAGLEQSRWNWGCFGGNRPGKPEMPKLISPRNLGMSTSFDVILKCHSLF